MTGDLAAIVAFNTARLAEDEAAAKAATPGPWRVGEDNPYYSGYAISTSGYEVAGPGYEGGGVFDRPDADHMVRHNPDRALRQVAAARRIMARHHADEHGMCAGCPTDTAGDPEYAIDECPEQRDVADIWGDNPEYQERWKP